MKLVRTSLEIDFYGEKITLRCPTYKEGKDYRDQLSALEKDADATEVLMNFLEKMGLPKEKFMELEFSHVNEVMEFLLGTKKK